MLAIQRSTNWPKLIKFFAGAALIFAVLYAYNITIVKADTVDWISTDPAARANDTIPYPVSDMEYRGCMKQNVDVAGVDLLSFSTPETICVFQADGFRYGVLDKVVRSGCCSTYQDTSLVVAYPTDTKMYRVVGPSIPTGDIIPILNSKHIIWCEHQGNGYRYHLKIVKNFREKITRVTNGIGVKYELNEGAVESLLNDEENNPIIVNAANTSTNGRWLAVELRVGGLVRLDLSTLTVKRFSNYTPSYGHGYDGHIEFSVSDSGRYIVSVGTNIDPRIFDLDGNCGITRSILEVERDILVSSCPERSLSTVTSDAIGGNLRFITRPKFDPLEGELILYASPYYRPNESNDEKQVTLTASGYNPPRLDYLALGDSYSSGEGDIDKKSDGSSYYTLLSDFDGGCHISTRSYPFLIANQYGISSDKMRSVTCSGAEEKDVLKQSNYLGQGDRYKDVSVDQLTLIKKLALDNYNPGRIEQIRFVEKTKPRAITLTIGGNDLGFGGKLRSCAINDKICEFASDMESRSKVGYEIQQQFTKLKDLYQHLHSVSPSTKIYVLGYPSFLNPDLTRKCLWDDGHLDANEKQFIDESIKYMNRVIKAATESVGIVYVDIEDSLNGGRICDIGGEYTTGIIDVGWFNNSQQYTAFHPNARGHEKITERIEQQLENRSILSYPYLQQANNSINTPEPSAYFTTAMQTFGYKGTQSIKMTDDSVIKSQPSQLTLESGTFESGSIVTRVVHSDPIDLGGVTAGNDGSLITSITIPSDVPVGYHTLILTGKSHSGEPLELYQTILVKGSNSNDIDEDGIVDTQDKCFFIPQVNIDIDMDNIDDACDPYVNMIHGLNDNDGIGGSKESTLSSSPKVYNNRIVAKQDEKDKKALTKGLVEKVADSNNSSTEISKFSFYQTLITSIAVILLIFTVLWIVYWITTHKKP